VDDQRHELQPRAQRRGPAWDTSIELWREQSPFYHSTKLRTPILVTCGERDFRVPCNNAIEFFMVLQRQQCQAARDLSQTRITGC